MGEKLVVRKTPDGRRVELQRDGQAVSWADLVYRRLRLGCAVLKTGGVANVGTKPQERRKGYGRRVINHGLKVMTADGLDISLLFGIKHFYDRFGFRSALSEYEILLPGRAVAHWPVGLAVRRLSAEEEVLTLPLYRRYLRRAALDLERHAGRWRGFVVGVDWRERPRVLGFFRGRRLAGYLVCDDSRENVQVSELEVSRSEDLPALLAWLGRQCRRRVAENIMLCYPPDQPAARLALELGATLQRRTFASGDGMMRILNLQSTIDALAPELAARWAAAQQPRGLLLALRTDMGEARLRLRPGRRGAATWRGRMRIPQDRLVQLVTGYLRPDALAARPGVRIPRSLLPALEVLFPERQSFILRTNRF
jgi:predicted acetyltransferase